MRNRAHKSQRIAATLPESPPVCQFGRIRCCPDSRRKSAWEWLPLHPRRYRFHVTVLGTGARDTLTTPDPGAPGCITRRRHRRGRAGREATEREGGGTRKPKVRERRPELAPLAEPGQGGKHLAPTAADHPRSPVFHFQSASEGPSPTGRHPPALGPGCRLPGGRQPHPPWPWPSEYGAP